jgi:orotate phosphoribosyltransferase
MFERSGALLKGHFLLTSGLHSPVYWEKVRVIQHPEYTEKLCAMIAGHFRHYGVEVVAGPTTPGVILAYETARQLGVPTRRSALRHAGVRGIFAEKDEAGGRVFRRGFEIKPGEKVLVVDDVLTTGGSVSDVIDAVSQAGGDVVGVGVLVLRAAQAPDFGVPFFACHKTEVVTYRPEACPLCAAGVPLVRPGSSQAKIG